MVRICCSCGTSYEDSTQTRPLLTAHTDAHLGATLPLIAEGAVIEARIELFLKGNGGDICWRCIGLLKLRLCYCIEKFEEDLRSQVF